MSNPDRTIAEQALAELARRELARRRAFGYGVSLDENGKRVPYGNKPKRA